MTRPAVPEVPMSEVATVADLPWFKLFADLPDHPKMLHLESIVGPGALDFTTRALCYIARYAGHGDLSRVPVPAIEGFCRWKGEPGALVKAWQTAGFVEADMRWHDWGVTQEAHVVASEKKGGAAERKRRQREKAKAAAELDAGVTGRDIACNSHADVTGVTRDMRVTPSLSLSSSGLDPDARDRVASTPPEPLNQAPITAPVGKYGETIPPTLDGILAHEHEGEPLATRWAKRAPHLDAQGIRDALYSAVTFMRSEQGPKLRYWWWPDGFVSKVDGWVKRDNVTATQQKAAESRVFKPRDGPADTDALFKPKGNTIKRPGQSQ